MTTGPHGSPPGRRKGPPPPPPNRHATQPSPARRAWPPDDELFQAELDSGPSMFLTAFLGALCGAVVGAAVAAAVTIRLMLG